jgi:N-acetylmuramoyl-L-alanine amidase
MRRKSVHRARRMMLMVLGLAVIGSIWSAQQLTRAGLGPSWLQYLLAAPAPTDGMHVALVSGHRGNDSGTVCADGLTEAEVNATVADRAAELLRAQGIRVDVFDEFDERLPGYMADAFVSIHADSCQSGFTGYKVAPPDKGAQASERLAECLWSQYEAATGLARHPSTITNNMTQYHAFRKISPLTPAAIIEIGFLGTDRALLTGEPERVAQGVADGITCFLTPPTQTPPTQEAQQ